MEEQYLGCFCRIYQHKDIIKELENTDLIKSLILDKFTEKSMEAQLCFQKELIFCCFMILETFVFYFAQN